VSSFVFLVSVVLVLSSGQTDRQTDRQNTEADRRYTRATTVGMRKIAGASAFAGFVAHINRKNAGRQRLGA